MPIEADRFNEMEDDGDETPGTNAHEILGFLRNNPDKAFTQTEIAEATDVKKGSVGPTLVRLRESDHDRSLDSPTALSGSVAESREEEEFNRDEWLEHAVDPREERKG